MPKLMVGSDVFEVPAGTIEAAVRSVGLHPDSYLYLRSGTPVPMDTEIGDGDEIKAVRVASGG